MTSRWIYPVGLLLDGHPCLVVGAGQVAARKAAALVDVGAKVTVIAPEIRGEFADLDVTVERRRFQASDAAGYRIVIAATGDTTLDEAIHAEGEALGVFVNAAHYRTRVRCFFPQSFAAVG